uniref:Uncharacterized protein n=1 Tax=Enterobacter cloacae TaxID=550 RepID=A0A6J4ELW9_ENTCL|nr:hypothetical protein [Enterobacter cloacae]
MQPLTGAEGRQIGGFQKQIGARAHHEGKRAFAVVIQIDNHRRGTMRRVKAHLLHLNLLIS